MKTLFIIPIQSISDVITNSSSEIFICNTNKTCKEVDELLVKMFGLESKGLQPAFLFNLEDYKKSKELYLKYDSFDYDDTFSKQRFKSEHPEFEYQLWEDYNGIYNVVDGWFVDKDNIEQLDSWRLSELSFNDDNPRFKPIFDAYNDWINIHPKIYNKTKYISYYTLLLGDEKTYDCNREFLRSIEGVDYLKSILDKLDSEFSSIQDLDGKILLLTTDDNSFNYDLFEPLYDTFNATSKHLG